MKPYSITVRHERLASEAAAAAHAAATNLRNWKSARPSNSIRSRGEFASESLQYRGRFTGYRGSNYIPLYTSFMLVANRYQAEYVCGFAGALTTRSLRAPAGTEWDTDGSLVLSSDYRVEYHPTSDDLLARDFGRRVLAGLRSALEKRAAMDRIQRERYALIPHLASVAVTLQDSRRAGNCDAGTLDFAARLGVGTEAAKSVPWLVCIPSAVLMRTGNERAEAACWAAAVRETTISI